MGVVNEPHGTGGVCALKDVKVAGKTGTAQVVTMAQNFRKGDTNRMPLEIPGSCMVRRLCPC